jgi:hypothetical protein
MRRNGAKYLGLTGPGSQAVVYSPGMREAYAWWTREFLDGLKAEVKVPQHGTSVRTTFIFASSAARIDPRVGDQLYFETPTGIEQIESLRAVSWEIRK